MYMINEYDTRYKPTNKSGGELKNADYVKLPVNPKGDGLQALLEHKKGLEVFGIWCLLLEKTTAQKPETRGKLLNHQDDPASFAEIAKSISLKGRENLVEYALNLLVAMGWVIQTDVAEISSEEFRNRGAKLSKDKISKGKLKETEQSSVTLAILVEEFEKEFWPNVPTKLGEGKARDSYINARKRVSKELILAGLPKYAEYEGRRSKQADYRPLHPSTWLNQERWSDELPGGSKAEREAAEQKNAEAKREALRTEYSSVYQEKTDDQLKAMRASDLLRSHWWLIDEIMAQRKHG